MYLNYKNGLSNEYVQYVPRTGGSNENKNTTSRKNLHENGAQIIDCCSLKAI